MRTLFLSLLVLAVLGSMGVGCGKAGSAPVSISNFSFQPATLTVPEGSTVTWTNSDNVAHTVSGSGLESGLISHGSSWSHKFATAGSFPYHCSPHPYMKGTVVVTPP